MLLALALPLTAGAEGQDPAVQEDALAPWDVASCKPGEWVKYEIDPGGGAAKRGYTLGCVAADAETVWIETDLFVPAADAGTVMLLGAGTKDGKIREAFWGKPGGAGRAILILPAARVAEAPGTCTGSVAADTVKSKDTAFDCEKRELTSTMRLNGASLTAVKRIWVSKAVAFRYRGESERVAWEKKPTVDGGVVRVETEAGGLKTTVTLVDWGADAKATLQRTEDDGGKK